MLFILDLAMIAVVHLALVYIAIVIVGAETG
jgi:hypothetical protein